MSDRKLQQPQYQQQRSQQNDKKHRNVTEYLQNNANNTQSRENKQKHEQQSTNVYSFCGERCVTSARGDICKDMKQQQQQQQQHCCREMISSPTSHSLNLNLINQPNTDSSKDFINAMGGQIVFNSNNPFLNDTFDAITTHEDEGGGEGGKIDTNFFDIDDTDLLVFTQQSTEKKTCEEMDEQLLKNKREKFSNTSTMKICLVVSPPTNKLFQLKSKSLTHLDRLNPQINISSNDLTAGKVSSSEYFSVCFDTENGFKDKDEIFIAASKGIALGDSLRQAMLQRNLSFSQISVIDYGVNNSNELGIPQYFGPLEINTDISVLAGHSLLITEKDNVSKKSGHYVLKKAASVGYRSTTSRLFTSTSTDECNESSDGKATKQTKQRWSLQLFGVKNPQQNQLCELLNTYMRSGVPKSKSSYINSEYSDEALDALYGLPQSWRDFVNANEMTELDMKIQSAIWELVTTEVDYIHALQTVTDLFLSCLEGIQSESLLKEIDQHKLFSNIRDICDANLKLWSLYLYPMVKHSMLTGHLMCIDYFQQGFTNFATIFEPYAKYCAEQVLCQNYCKDLNRNNALFTTYLAWCESQKECNRLKLADILVRPMQRLTKYSLLLSAIRKHISEENEAEIMDAMIHSVDDFVCSVNSHLTTRQESERLKGIMARIESYDVVDSSNESLEKFIKQYSQMFDLCSPMKGCVLNQGRYLFLEGDMKYKDNVSKMDVHCFLLTDILLVCKQTVKKGHGNLKVVRQPFVTDRLVIKLKEKENAVHCVYLNDFNMVVAAFALQCNGAKNWYDGINKARHIYSKLKQDFDGASLRVLPQQHNQVNTDSLTIRKSPLGSSIDLNESKTVSVDFEKTNSISSDEGSYNLHNKHPTASVSRKLRQTSSNSLTVQSFSNHLNQSMPNLSSGPYHAYSNNTLLVPGAPKSQSAHSSHSGNLLSPSQRGISYPPPSPTRATLRRGFAFSTSINNKNPPLIKSRNVTSLNWAHQQSMAAAAAAGTASNQPSHIQVVYEPMQTNNDTKLRSETNTSDT
ncbi:CLUMA_CG016274, isoform B [Clunio marinus]|uniref:CLUMA_CG016274, isoform B n=1 Tax=Clunio marinus TaxID=568069 RepID=A0A1J1IVH8_9DIPT|nr:CLUMA_CG016274, isoform B [Clunio marinus]